MQYSVLYEEDFLSIPLVQLFYINGNDVFYFDNNNTLKVCNAENYISLGTELNQNVVKTINRATIRILKGLGYDIPESENDNYSWFAEDIVASNYLGKRKDSILLEIERKCKKSTRKARRYSRNSEFEQAILKNFPSLFDKEAPSLIPIQPNTIKIDKGDICFVIELSMRTFSPIPDEQGNYREFSLEELSQFFRNNKQEFFRYIRFLFSKNEQINKQLISPSYYNIVDFEISQMSTADVKLGYKPELKNLIVSKTFTQSNNAEQKSKISA